MRYFNPRRYTLARFFWMAVLVLGTYNPTGYSIFHLIASDVIPLSVTFVACLVMGVLWYAVMGSVYGALGPRVCVGIMGILAGLYMLAFMEAGLPLTYTVLEWASCVTAILFLGIGSSWATWRFKFFGVRGVYDAGDDHTGG